MLALLSHRRIRFLLWLGLALGLSACAWVGSFSARSHEQLTALKATHLKSIDVQTQTERARPWNPDRLAQDADALDLRFREALEYAQSLDDPVRTQQLHRLREVWAQDLQLMQGKQRLLRPEEARVLGEATASAYDLAIRAECARIQSHCRSR